MMKNKFTANNFENIKNSLAPSVKLTWKKFKKLNYYPIILELLKKKLKALETIQSSQEKVTNLLLITKSVA